MFLLTTYAKRLAHSVCSTDTYGVNEWMDYFQRCPTGLLNHRLTRNSPHSEAVGRASGAQDGCNLGMGRWLETNMAAEGPVLLLHCPPLPSFPTSSHATSSWQTKAPTAGPTQTP